MRPPFLVLYRPETAAIGLELLMGELATLAVAFTFAVNNVFNKLLTRRLASCSPLYDCPQGADSPEDHIRYLGDAGRHHPSIAITPAPFTDMVCCTSPANPDATRIGRSMPALPKDVSAVGLLY